ncbi:MAG: selenide, water dikinase SelD [Bacteroidia bacterium]
MNTVKLTAFSSSSGCGCKLAPAVLEQILGGLAPSHHKNLLVGPEKRDDAAVLKLSGTNQQLIATTDFFTPLVDDAYDFGRIAATNALSDIYAMGGKPILALSVLIWPTQKLAAELAAEVLRGAQEVCETAGIPLAGGHSIDGPEPVFGLSVNGLVDPHALRTNAGGKPGDLLYLSKPLGIGILASALKREKISTTDYFKLLQLTTELNQVGALLGELPYVHGLTDVTGFGLLGHLLELCEASACAAELILDKVPLIPGLQTYLDQFILPDQVYRNWNAYSTKVTGVTGAEFMYLCDPQTSGGLLISIDAQAALTFENRMQQCGQSVWQIGRLLPGSGIQLV